MLARRRPLPARRRATGWHECAARRARGTTAGRALRARRAAAAGSSRSRRGSTASRSWRDELQRKVDAGQEDLSGELAEGARSLLRRAETLTRRARRSPATPRRPSRAEAERCRSRRRYERRRRPSTACAPLRLLVRALPALVGRLHRRRARCCRELAELGFDVVYLPPIHPIGDDEPQGPRTTRSTAGPDDPGSPWAIGVGARAATTR